MKLFKKSLILVSTVALGFTLAGCSKKNALLNEAGIYKLNGSDSYVQYKSITQTAQLEVKSYSKIKDSIIRYISPTDEYVIYDVKYGKEIFKTTEKIYNVVAYGEGEILSITYDDEDKTRQIIGANGQTIFERGKYKKLSTEIIKITPIDKNDVCEEKIVKFIVKSENDTDNSVFYYKVTVPQKKNEKGKADGKDYDKTHYTFKSINEEEAIIVKKGDKYDLGSSGYRVNYNSDYFSVTDYKTLSTIFEMTYEADDVECIKTNDKALLQIMNKTTSETVYDVIDSKGNKYVVDTYEITFKDGSYKRLDNYEYFLKDIDTMEYDDKTIVLGASLVKGNMEIETVDFIVDKSLKNIQDSAKYIYNQYSYWDLGNGYYLEDSNNGNVYFTDKNGIIKKTYSGFSQIIEKAKVIIIADNARKRFAIYDFKGNLVREETYSYSSYETTSFGGYNFFYVDAKTGDSHLMTFEKGELVNNEIVDYDYADFINYNKTYTVDNVSEAYRYYTQRRYVKAELIDYDTDFTYDAFTFTFYDLLTNEEIGKIEEATNISTYTQYDDGVYNVPYFYATTNVTEDSYTLTVYKLVQ